MMAFTPMQPVDGPAFSNSDEWDRWSSAWCDRCIHDAPNRAGRPEEGCPLILTAYLGQRPGEWIPGDGYGRASYTCVMFRDEDNGDDREPKPLPEPPDMDGLFERPQPSARMLKPAGWPVDALT